MNTYHAAHWSDISYYSSDEEDDDRYRNALNLRRDNLTTLWMYECPEHTLALQIEYTNTPEIVKCLVICYANKLARGCIATAST